MVLVNLLKISQRTADTFIAMPFLAVANML